MRSLLLLVGLGCSALGAQMDVWTIEGKTLLGNPLGDRAERRVALVSPNETEKSKTLPLVLYLPGWGSSSEDTIAQARGGWIGQAVDALAAKGHELRIVVVDARSRYGGSQYVNSTATGNYADYVAVEVLAAVKEKYSVAGTRPIVAGHSSGGYGAVMLAIRRHETFGAVVGLSPDSDFETTHRPLVQEAAAAVSPEVLAAAMAPAKLAHVVPGLAGLVMGLSANYTPDAAIPGRFEWLYDAHAKWRPEVWARWIACDPLTVVRENADAFAPDQRVYLDGAELDEFGANIGARKIAAVLEERGAQVEFNQPKGHHAEHLAERLTRGLAWVLAK